MMRFVMAHATAGESTLVEPWWAVILIVGVALLTVCAVMAESVRH
jgi:hypothetical protein